MAIDEAQKIKQTVSNGSAPATPPPTPGGAGGGPGVDG
jgi:hypothetical protein